MGPRVREDDKCVRLQHCQLTTEGSITTKRLAARNISPLAKAAATGQKIFTDKKRQRRTS